MLPRFAALRMVRLAVATFGCGVLLAGCPVQQRPTVSEPDDPAAEPPPPASTPGAIERPVTPPPGPGNAGTSSSSSGGGGASEPTPSAPKPDLIVRAVSPTSPTRVRGDGQIDFSFEFLDARGAVQALTVVVAADANADGKPDAAPLLSRPVAAAQAITHVALAAADLVGSLTNGYGQFVVGISAATVDGVQHASYAAGAVIVDVQAPSGKWLLPAEDLMSNRTTLPVKIAVQDNSAVTARVMLDPDTLALSGNEIEWVAPTVLPAGASALSAAGSLFAATAGLYHYYVTLSDGIAPPTGFYAKNAAGALLRVKLTDRLIGEMSLNTLVDSERGAILSGFNFNDLGGSSLARVPDLSGDGADELLIASRFGKPYIINGAGVGFGEAYLIFGDKNTRLRKSNPLNAVGKGNISGLAIAGIRCPMNTTWTEGMSDVAVVPDMDGDDLPELVFGFPRVESVSLGNKWAAVQHPELMPDVPNLGEGEYDAYYPDGFGPPTWHKNEAQFTRGGIVIVSSSTVTLRDAQQLNRKGNRVLDLHEVGQNFSSNGWADYKPFIRAMEEKPGPQFAMCGSPPQQTEYEDWTIKWDIVINNQGPGGFYNRFVGPSWFADPVESKFQPPLANLRPLGLFIGFLDSAVPPISNPCDPGNCIRKNVWWSHVKDGGFPTFPNTITVTHAAWHSSGFETGGESGIGIWTGFYGSGSVEVSPFPDAVGARLLGQRREDRFGMSVGSDGTWLYISAPLRTADKDNDVPSLEADRTGAGVVYQLRTDNRATPTAPTLTQLWIEPGTREIPKPPGEPNQIVTLTWPNVDAQQTTREDWTMPVPHQYIIEDIGYLRGRDLYWSGAPGEAEEGDRLVLYESQTPCNGPLVSEEGGVVADAAAVSPLYPNYSFGKAAFYVDRTPQIVGPHVGANISFVRALGDVNGDGIRDFAVGSSNVRQEFSNPQSPAGATVGGVFIVYGRTPGLEGDYLLDRLALDVGAPDRINGVFVKGASPGETLARVFAPAGDVNGDGYDDVIIGNEGAEGGAGEAILLFGSPTLLSPGPNDPGGVPGGGWTPETIPPDRGVRIRGKPGDLVGANVASAGDVDGDGLADVLVACPGMDGGRGAVYLVYGAKQFDATIDVATLSPKNLGVASLRLTGRAAGDFLGGGSKLVAGTDPNGGSATALSQGLAPLGDIDGDGAADFAISAMLADPGGKTDAGEVYVLYGRRGP